MPQLLHLDGRPQTWDELHARLADYYRRREQVENEIRARVCGACTGGSHWRCSGLMARVPGARAGWDTVECPCECWEEVR